MKLHLNLKRKWFDMILSGEKKEEYREIKPYYNSRFVDFYCGRTLNDLQQRNHYMIDIAEDPKKVIKKINWRRYDSVIFSNGYSKNRDQFEITLENIKIDSGKTKWRAVEYEICYVLTLGIVKTNLVSAM